jgi:cell division septation protein DedD
MARAPVPSAAAVEGAKTGWAIQLGAFRTAGAPQALYARMQSKLEGKQPVYHAVGKLTRLLVGPYASRLDAAAACRRIGSSNGCMIVPFK